MLTLRSGLLVGLSVLFFQSGFSQNAVPQDPAIRTGKLENGLTYFIRQNAKPADKVELRLAIKAGSVLEDEKQLGLAHFVEHMAFNGTASFKENDLVSFLQSSGVEFGADLNAYTSFNETVYILPLPRTSLKLIEKGFQVLYEWAAKITFDAAEIDKERGIVIEEWRGGRGAQERIFNKQIGIILQGSRYAERLPIGTRENLEGFKHEDLKRFYKDWYRPELMAVIVAGDIDPDWAEKQIKSLFSKIPASAKPVKVPAYPVPGHAETLVSVETDPELTETSVQVLFKHPKRPYHTEDGYRERIKRALFTQIFNARLRERSLEAKPPFLYASSGYSGGIAPDRDFFSLDVFPADSAILSGFEALLMEAERIKRFGVTAPELNRAKVRMLRAYEKAYEERSNQESDDFAEELVNLFIDGEPAPGIAYEFNFVKTQLETFTTEDVSRLAKTLITDENRVLTVSAPAKEGLVPPTKEALLSVMEAVNTVALEPWTEEAVATTLLEVQPEKGRVIRKKEFVKAGIHEWKLSNGVTVVLKPTLLKNDQILMSATSWGGTSTATDGNYFSALIANQYVRQSGAGPFSLSDLDKFLAGKAVSVRPSIADYSEGFGGQASPRDLETMMQLIYVYATRPRADSAAFSNIISNYREFIRNLHLDPQQQFFNKTSVILYQNHLRARWIDDLDDLGKIRPDSALAFYRERFADFSDFTFFFTGSFTPEQIQPFVERYLASLPVKKRTDFWTDRNMTMTTAKIDSTFKIGLEPKAIVRMIWNGPAHFDQLSRYEMASLGALLDIVLVDEIREKMSGVYGISAGVSLSKIPSQHYQCEITFPCAPENVEAITARVREILAELVSKGPTETDVDKIKATQRNQTRVAQEANEYWHRTISDYYINGFNIQELQNWEKRTAGLSAAALQKRAAQVFRGEVEKRFVLLPAQNPAPEK